MTHDSHTYPHPHMAVTQVPAPNGSHAGLHPHMSVTQVPSPTWQSHTSPPPHGSHAGPHSTWQSHKSPIPSLYWLGGQFWPFSLQNVNLGSVHGRLLIIIANQDSFQFFCGADHFKFYLKFRGVRAQNVFLLTDFLKTLYTKRKRSNFTKRAFKVH